MLFCKLDFAKYNKIVIYNKKVIEKFAYIKKKQYLCIVKIKKISQMKTSEFLKLASKQGMTFIRHGSNHDVYLCKATGRVVTIPRHKSEEIKKGLEQNLLKQVGLK